MRYPRSELWPEDSFTPQELSWIGCVAITSAYLDSWLDEIIARHLGKGHKFAKTVTTKLQLSGKAELLRRLAEVDLEHPKPGAWAAFNVIYDGMTTAIQERNDVIHGEWLVDLDGAAVARRNDRRLDGKKCRQIAIRLQKSYQDLQAFEGDWPSPQKPA